MVNGANANSSSYSTPPTSSSCSYSVSVDSGPLTYFMNRTCAIDANNRQPMLFATAGLSDAQHTVTVTNLGSGLGINQLAGVSYAGNSR